MIFTLKAVSLPKAELKAELMSQARRTAQISAPPALPWWFPSPVLPMLIPPAKIPESIQS